jgi:hypothetical protein
MFLAKRKFQRTKLLLETEHNNVKMCGEVQAGLQLHAFLISVLSVSSECLASCSERLAKLTL